MSAELMEIPAALDEPASKPRPWLRWYGTVPASLSYPKITLYDAVSATARRTPQAVAWDFMDTVATYGQFLLPTSPQGVVAFPCACMTTAASGCTPATWAEWTPTDSSISLIASSV